MKPLKLLLVIVIFLTALSNANAQTLKISAQNLMLSLSDSITFEYWITNQTTEPIYYLYGQYFANIPKSSLGGATSGVTLRILASDLPANFVPRNPTIFWGTGDTVQLRLAANQSPGSGNGLLIPVGANLMVCRLSLRLPSGYNFPCNGNAYWNFWWRTRLYAAPQTKIFVDPGGSSVEYTNVSYIKNLSWPPTIMYDELQIRAYNYMVHSPDSVTFDISLYNPVCGITPFYYLYGQYYANINRSFINGAPDTNVHFSIIDYGIPTIYCPINPSVYYASPDTMQLKLEANPSPGIGNGYSIPAGTNQILVRCALKLTGGYQFASGFWHYQWRERVFTSPKTLIYRDNSGVEQEYDFVEYVTSFPGYDNSILWQMQIQSQIDTVYDNENYAGVADSATEGFDSEYDIPEPPQSPGNYISTYFYHPEWGVITGTDFASDIKQNTSITDTVKRWFFFVKTNILNDTVKLTFLNDSIPSSFGKYLTDLTTGQRINLKTTSEYKYYNTSDTARQFELIIGDNIAPSLTLLYPNGSNIFRSGTTKNINWTASDGTGIDSIFIYTSTNAGINYTLLQGLGYSQTTTWQIPNEYLNNDYSIKITARDSLGNTNSAKSLNTFTVVGDSLASTANAGWNLISLPFIPGDSTSVKIFGDDFGSSPYYLWSYGYGTGYVIPSYLLNGKGYWLGALSSKVWDIRGTAIDYDSTVQNLELGFNLIGNNYVRGISKNTLQFIKSGMQYTYDSAVASGLITSAIYKYNGTGYSTSDTLGLFNGYWLGVLQTGVQMIQKPLPSTVIPLNPMIANATPDDWELSLNASTSTLSDEISKIGVKPDATPGYDAKYDSPRPPRAPGSNYLELYFEHSGGNWPPFLGNKYAVDISSPANPSWIFKIDCSQTNTPVSISWNRQYLISIGSGVILTMTDNTNNQSVNMKSDSAYTFTYNGIRTFTINSIITGTGTITELPTEYGMSQNYPNPFNPVTRIKYQLPGQAFVTIKIYDILGKEVATLVNESKNAGYYEISFNASQLSSGIYFYKMTAGEYVNIKKLVILK